MVDQRPSMVWRGMGRRFFLCQHIFGGSNIKGGIGSIDSPKF